MDHPKASDALVPELRVLLWSAPRCCSSAFERSVRELKSVKVLYEPHQKAFYYGPERRTDSNISTTCDTDPTATFRAADEQLLLQYSNHQAVFAKNHAFFVEGRYRKYIEGLFSRFKHTFLIRHPHKSLPSVVRARKECGYPISPTDNGIKQLYELFKTVQELDPSPVVIDADDLLMNPRELMERYCTATGLPFEASMLNWTPGVVQDWTELKNCSKWHETVIMSTGFVKPAASGAELLPSTSLPKEIEDAVQEAIPFYEAMYAARMKPCLGL